MKKYLFLLAFVINSLFADVFEYNDLKTEHSNDVIVETMKTIQKTAYKNADLTNLVKKLSGQCKIENVKEYCIDRTYKGEFQMSGWGMFVPTDITKPEDIKVCIAVKRKKDTGKNENDPNYWHTERQIVDYLLRNNGWQSPGKDGTTNIGGSGKQGTLYIYSYETPCGTADSAYTSPISCVAYYHNLKELIKGKGLTLQIYAQQVVFSVTDFTKSDANAIKQINGDGALQDAIKKGIDKYVQMINSIGVFTLPTNNIEWNKNASASNWAELLKRDILSDNLSIKQEFNLFNAISGIEVQDCFDRQDKK